MSIIRVEKTKDYTIMSNYHLKEKNMSLKAKGLMSLMLSLPDNWDYSIAGLVAICRENETAVKSTLDELKLFGYLQVIKKNPNETESGRFEYEYVLSEKKQDIEKQGIENLGLEFLGTENQGQLNTNKQTTNELNTNNKKERKKGKFDEIIDAYTNDVYLKGEIIEFIKMRERIKKPMTDRALQLMLLKLDNLSNGIKENKIKILDNSIMNCWQGIFDLRADEKQNAKNKVDWSKVGTRYE